MITKITCRYSFEVLDFHCNDFGFTFNIGVSYLGIFIRHQGLYVAWRKLYNTVRCISLIRQYPDKIDRTVQLYWFLSVSPFLSWDHDWLDVAEGYPTICMSWVCEVFCHSNVSTKFCKRSQFTPIPIYVPKTFLVKGIHQPFKGDVENTFTFGQLIDRSAVGD